MPTLLTWEEAKKSPLGEKVTEVATLFVRNASIIAPVGKSKVRITQSAEVATSQRESEVIVFKSIANMSQRSSWVAKGDGSYTMSNIGFVNPCN